MGKIIKELVSQVADMFKLILKVKTFHAKRTVLLTYYVQTYLYIARHKVMPHIERYVDTHEGSLCAIHYENVFGSLLTRIYEGDKISDVIQYSLKGIDYMTKLI